MGWNDTPRNIHKWCYLLLQGRTEAPWCFICCNQQWGLTGFHMLTFPSQALNVLVAVASLRLSCKVLTGRCLAPSNVFSYLFWWISTTTKKFLASCEQDHLGVSPGMGDSRCHQLWNFTERPKPSGHHLLLIFPQVPLPPRAWEGSFHLEILDGIHIPLFPGFLLIYCLKKTPPCLCISLFFF